MSGRKRTSRGPPPPMGASINRPVGAIRCACLRASNTSSSAGFLLSVHRPRRGLAPRRKPAGQRWETTCALGCGVFIPPSLRVFPRVAKYAVRRRRHECPVSPHFLICLGSPRLAVAVCLLRRVWKTRNSRHNHSGLAATPGRTFVAARALGEVGPGR